jgi:hypothetical protein
MAMMAMMATTESPMVASTLVHHESKSHAQTRAKNFTEFTKIAMFALKRISALVASVDEQH